MASSTKYTSIIFDLGDVLFQWSADTKTSVSPKLLRSILSSPTWYEYERGRLSEQECYDRVGQDFDIVPSEIRKALDQARDSLVASHGLIQLIRELKEESKGALRVYAMSNISLPDWEVLKTKPADWSIFDQIFTSGAAGERKPNLGFYRHVISATGVDPRTTIFVDDKHENVLSARSCGLHGIVFDNEDAVRRALRNLIGDPIARGKSYLQANAKNLHSVTANTEKQPAIILHENFAQLLILEATNDRDLVNLVEHERAWNFFHHGKGVLTTEQFPFDVDTTSVAYTVLKSDKALANSVMDDMLQYVDKDGIMQTYFDHTRPRFDPVVCANALTLFYMYGRGGELSKTLQWVYEVLLNRAYVDGTRYYRHPECFLYCISRLLAASGDPDLHAQLKPLLKTRVQECIGAEGDALQLAMRIIVCEFVGIRDEIDLRALLPLQCEDGSWEIGWVYNYGTTGLLIGNKGLTTALAVKAVESLSLPVLHIDPPSPTLTIVQPPSPTEKRASIFSHKRQRSSSFKNTFQWLWHGGKMRKSVEISS
ncbi:hypothetical protein EST38_g879 [Candolleomyces aberdarensis]|uniref:Uncharacterized protein n=1 Tax=Candolleomyces aberdarensis TaxID=2316362 RepID=A0A4Q2DWZ8_9AGAR|nr:hypothetical protein EST38_g879 [Candolleomyces aberdarensis]